MIRRAIRDLFAPASLLGWAPVAVVFAVGVGLSLWSIAAQRSDRDMVVRSREVREAGQALLLGVTDAETGQRGFVITGAPAYLAPYEAGRRKAEEALGRLDALVTDKPTQRERLARLRELAAHKLEEVEAVIDARSAGGFEAARTLVASDVGRRAMDAIREVVREVDDSEARTLRDWQAELRRAEMRGVAIGAGVALLSIVVRFATTRLRRRLRLRNDRSRAQRDARMA